MALEKTVLNEAKICELLEQHYDICVVEIQKLAIGSANCYRIFDGCKYYFLKEFQRAFSEETVIREACLVQYLSDANIPVARFFKTATGAYAFSYQNHVICLEEYIDGQAYGYDDLPKHLLPSIAQMLGKLHFTMRDYPLPTDMGEKWLASYSADILIEQYDVLLEEVNRRNKTEKLEQIKSDLEYKKLLAVRCEEYKKYYTGVTYSATHGDYQGCQLVFDGDEIKAVIDFSSACTLPVTWEIMRSFVQSSRECREKVTIDIAAFCEYVRAYMNYFPLSKTDLQSMPYVYLFQLARSKYGYPQYLNTASEDREGLLQFAFWRTDMCRVIEKRAEEISNELLKLSC